MSRISYRRAMRSWSRRQFYSFFSSLGNLYSHILGTLMTVLVLGIAMLLPLSLYIALENIAQIDLKQRNWGAITVFMSESAGKPETEKLAMQINARSDASALIISPDEGMAEFSETSGLGQAIDLFDENPLPWVLHVTPVIPPDEQLEQVVDLLSVWLKAQASVDLVQLDHKWLQRLAGMTDLAKALASVMTVMFSLAVLVVVANTIRLDVAARSEEIQILSLVGAGNNFIRQPFLYSGFWYGTLGALLALVLLRFSLGYLDEPLRRLLESYGNEFDMINLGFSEMAMLLLLGGLLGLLGALFSVQRHLRLIRIGLKN